MKMTNKRKYETGPMPVEHLSYLGGQEFHNQHPTYEDFENFLGNFYLSFNPLKHSSGKRHKECYQKVKNILNRFAQEYGVQSPEEAIKNPRTGKIFNAPGVMSASSMFNSIKLFWRVFNIGRDLGTKDGQDAYDLESQTLMLFDTSGILRLSGRGTKGEQIIGVDIDNYWPEGTGTNAEIESWDTKKMGKTLAEILQN
jgi:hypothetical protein